MFTFALVQNPWDRWVQLLPLAARTRVRSIPAVGLAQVAGVRARSFQSHLPCRVVIACVPYGSLICATGGRVMIKQTCVVRIEHSRRNCAGAFVTIIWGSI